MVQAGQQAAPNQAGQSSAQSSVTTVTTTATTASAASSSSTAPAKSPEAQDASPLEYTVTPSYMKDYHKAFNGTNFKAWFRDQLLPNLHQPSLIMLDNAAYHRVKP